MPSSRTVLKSGWEFSQVSSETSPSVKEEWLGCKSMPTSVHVELLKHGKIEHPYKDLKEWDVQCEYSSLSGQYPA